MKGLNNLIGVETGSDGRAVGRVYRRDSMTVTVSVANGKVELEAVVGEPGHEEQVTARISPTQALGLAGILLAAVAEAS